MKSGLKTEVVFLTNIRIFSIFVVFSEKKAKRNFFPLLFARVINFFFNMNSSPIRIDFPIIHDINKVHRLGNFRLFHLYLLSRKRKRFFLTLVDVFFLLNKLVSPTLVAKTEYCSQIANHVSAHEFRNSTFFGPTEMKVKHEYR